MQSVTAIILGGGAGTRLSPLTLERAKPAVGFAGKYRLIDIPLSNCINSGIKKVFVLTQFLSASLHRHIMQAYQFDVFTDGFINILAAEQTQQGKEWFQGTADAVRATLKHTTSYQVNEMLILSGDHLYRMDYAGLIDFHRRTGAEITLCVYPVEREAAPRMGLVRVDDDGLVKEFVEKPKDPAVIERFRAPASLFPDGFSGGGGEWYLASMGVYVFTPGVLSRILHENTGADFGREVIPETIGQRRVAAYPFTGYWMDIGTIESFFEANLALVRPEPPFPLYQPGWPIYTRTRSLPPSRIFHSEIVDSLVVEGSDISGARIEESIIGVRSIIREGTAFDRVVMMGADFYEGEQEIAGASPGGSGARTPLGVGRNCSFEQVILDKNVRIGDNVTIRAQPDVREAESKYRWIRDGITIIPRGTVIPAGSVL